MKDYASPIEMITNSIIKSNEEQLEDCMLFSVEREIGFKVDKEELIKALEYDRNQSEKGFEDGLRSAVDWIPVSERLPEDNKTYLVTVELTFARGERYVSQERKDNWDKLKECGHEIIAWMPLPEPYKASPTGSESEEKK